MRVEATAPGKVIFTGEHFVVHGGLALVGAIDRGVKVTAWPSATTRLHSLPLNLTADEDRPPPAALAPYMQVLRALETRIGGLQHATYQIDATLPSAAGLGSSAAVAVALALAAATLHEQQLSETELAAIAIPAERAIHGNPSGIDIQIAIRGGILYFRKGQSAESCAAHNSLPLVIAYTGAPRATGEFVRRVEEVRTQRSVLFDALLAASSRLTREGGEALRKGDYAALGTILTFHHHALKLLGVSTPHLDLLVTAALAAGAYGAKLTGAGGGGCIVAVPPSNQGPSIERKLGEHAELTFITTVPQQGARAWRVPS